MKALVEGYEYFEKSVSKRRAWIFVRLMDLDAALARLDLELRQAIFLCGFLGYTEREAGTILGVSQPTAHRRYRDGLYLLTTWLNGGTT